MIAPGRTGARLAIAILGSWALAALVLVVAGWDDILVRRFSDADDQMRLLQVRDWLAGQGWFDVAQHRLNGGDFPMHWSRLVDLPLAGTIILLRPVLGVALAERVTLVVVPLLTLLCAITMAALIARRVGGDRAAIGAAVAAALPGPMMFQMRPLRIDHHGWQVVLALVTVHAMVGRPTARGGAIAGAALAALLTVSLEGMPIVAAVLGVAALVWAFRPARWRFLRALGLTLAGSVALLHLATRGPEFWAPACDAIAPAWLAVLAIGGGGLALATGVRRYGFVARIVTLAGVGVAAAGTLLALAPACLAGPFATLPPIIYRLWYLGVHEGRPLWEQDMAVVPLVIGVPLFGLAGAILAWREAPGEARLRWTILIASQVASAAIAILVLRAGATANALAMPGAGSLLATLFLRARALPRLAPRLAATLGLVPLAAPGTAVTIAMLAVAPAEAAKDELPAHRRACRNSLDMRAMAALPPGVVFAPIDMTPSLLLDTDHRAIAGGYHRSAKAMEKVMLGFIASPERARAVVLASHADYLAVCPGRDEMELYRSIAPHGLWARLERGERISWLKPVPIRGPALAWRVIGPLPEGRSAP